MITNWQLSILRALNFPGYHALSLEQLASFLAVTRVAKSDLIALRSRGYVELTRDNRWVITRAGAEAAKAK